MRHTHPHVAVKRSRAGLGLFAKTPFKRGELIIEYTGDIISTEEADRRGGKYLFILSDTLVIDGKDHKNLGRYINHGCKPNAEAETDEDERKIRIHAKRAIKPGEEITYHYGKEYWNTHIKPHGCKCTSCIAA
jgi:SET domain-containing protein